MSKEQDKTPGKADETYFRVLSHQLKAPINSIQSLLNTIMDGFTGELNSKTRYFIERAMERSDEAKTLLNDLLDYEYYSQKDQIQKTEFPLIKLVMELAEKYRSLASEKELILESSLPADLELFVLGDAQGIQLALRNLLENAIKYTPANGRVSLELQFLTKEKTCEIRVSDTGFGIPETDLVKIFDPFYRSIKHKSNITGTGLGLPIVKRVIVSHQGQITVQSKENQGTTFMVTLPIAKVKRSKTAAREKKKVLIIGGVTAGPKAAARLRRLDEELDITIIEKSEHLSYSGCGLPYYISSRLHSPKSLMSTADNTIRDINFFQSIKNIRILNNTLATEVDRKTKRVMVRDLKKASSATLSYDYLVLATGSQASVPDIPGIDLNGIYSIQNIDDAEAIRKELASHRAQDIYIIGGGLIGISTAEAFLETGARVTILEKETHILLGILDEQMADKIQNTLRKKGVKIILETIILGIEAKENYLAIKTNKGDFNADFIILSAGVKPNADLAKKAGLDIGVSGGIKVNKYLQTTDKNIFAIGDCAESINLITKQYDYWPLGSISTKMGRIAADNICEKKSEFNGSIGTVIFKIFDMAVARTGLTTKKAAASGFNPESIVVTGLDRSHYHADAKNLFLKLICDRDSRKILGAQGYSQGDIVSKIGILASAITQSLTLDEVFKLDLGYHPAFNRPIDILQTACLALKNKLEGMLKTITFKELEQQQEVINIIDLSPLSDYIFRSIPGSINIPLERLRTDGIPFPKEAKTVLYSHTSSGAYMAYLYLTSKGYQNLYVLEGGLIYWDD